MKKRRRSKRVPPKCFQFVALRTGLVGFDWNHVYTSSLAVKHHVAFY